MSGRSWENQVSALVDAGHRVITYDRRGFGASSQPWEGYDYDTFAADLHALLEALDVRGPHQRAQRIYARDIGADASPKGTFDCIAAFGRTAFRADLEKVTVPTLVIHGDSDGIVPFEVSGERSHEAIADNELVLIKGGPHGFNATTRTSSTRRC